MSEPLKSHAEGLLEIKNQQGNREENLTNHVRFVYAYVKNAKNRKINDEKGGDK